jgi:hypothetical protein
MKTNFSQIKNNFSKAKGVQSKKALWDSLTRQLNEIPHGALKTNQQWRKVSSIHIDFCKLTSFVLPFIDMEWHDPRGQKKFYGRKKRKKSDRRWSAHHRKLFPRCPRNHGHLREAIF